MALNECIFTYPNTEWYSVYLLDSAGQKFWDSATGKVAQIYFKIGYPSSDAKKPFVIEEQTAPPADLPENVCRVNEKGNCETIAQLKPTKAKKKEGEVVPAQEVAPEVMARLAPLALSAARSDDSKGAKKQIPREYFEQIKDKAIIVQWMIDNMT